jgi:hypothetical protein
MATQIQIENNIHLERLLISHPEMEKKVRKIVRQVLKGAQASVAQAADLQSTKQAAMAVRKAVYKKLLGGNINILDSRGKAGTRAPLPPESPRKKSHHRGGNRMPRTRRTEDLLTYAGKDRAFILRFLNSGTPKRSTNGVRNVGQIAARGWFDNASHKAIQHAAEQFDILLEQLIKQEFSK